MSNPLPVREHSLKGVPSLPTEALKSMSDLVIELKGHAKFGNSVWRVRRAVQR